MPQHEQLPRHIAIIPDGNRRWAQAKQLKPIEGHRAGAQAFRAVAEYAAKRGIEYLSIWGLSLDNVARRPSLEVRGLLNLFTSEFRELAKTKFVHDEKINISVIGEWRETFPLPLRREIENVIAATKDYHNKYVTFFLAYDGIADMVHAVQAIAEKTHAEKRATVTAATIKQHLLTKELPPVDLLIRTAGEPHLSGGFLMWDTTDAALHFSPRFWPDFTPEAFEEALQDYLQRQRRFGG
ncbi:MAG: polyprenyl diphosphate synthase [Candidatus Andersenbacteria bacterium]